MRVRSRLILSGRLALPSMRVFLPRLCGLVLLAVVSAAATTNGAAGESTEPERKACRVGIYVNPPFVMRDNDECTGMAIDLWREVVNRLNLVCGYTEYNSLGSLVDAARAGEVDVCVTNLAVTSERAQKVFFTYPWFDSGLRIAVPVREHVGLWQRLLRSGHAYAYLLLFLLFVGVALVATVIRRWYDAGFTHSWLDGFTTSLKEVISVAKSGELPSHKPNWLRNILVSAWMICGMAILAYITSTVTSAMTAASIRHEGGIVELADLPGKNVGVLTGSGAEGYLGQLGVHVLGYDTREEAISAMKSGNVAGFVADSAVLEYYAAKHPEQHIALTGQLFHKYKFAFAVDRRRIELADAISVVLIDMHESGALANLHVHYFGRPDTRSGAGVMVPLASGER